MNFAHSSSNRSFGKEDLWSERYSGILDEDSLEYPLDFYYNQISNANESILVRGRRQARCSSDQFRCKDGTCIDYDKPCDGKVDCPDGSDETFARCRKIRCQNIYFRCSYGACIEKRLKCNKKQDCADNSDELHKDCRKGEAPRPKCSDPDKWMCPNSDQCIDMDSVCDGQKDCRNGNDETIAECSSIGPCDRFFKCAYGPCIHKAGKCNYITECADGSDEDPEVCGPGYTPATTLAPPTTTPMRPIVRPVNPQTGNACVMPSNTPNSKYSLLGGSTPYPGEVIGDQSVLKLDCQGDSTTSMPNLLFCSGTKWAGKIPTCESMCDPPESSTVVFTCSVLKDGTKNRIDCDRRVPSGTEAFPACQSGHKNSEPLKKLTCKSGSWDYNMPRCNPNCGTVIPKGVANVILGVDARKGEFPWHVAIYTQYKQEGLGLDPKYWCGGSILNRNTVISAAHCFYDPLQRKSFDPSLFTIAVGKMYSPFNHIEQNKEMHIQKSMVKDIKIPEFYTGEGASYANDLALLILETPLNFSNLVLPVCLDINDQNFDDDQSSPGIIAKVAGFGLVQSDSETIADVLKTTSMPIISRVQCREDSPVEFEKYIISDKLCAGYLNGTGVCKGDSGGGLVVKTFIKNVETWYLRGIVSTAPSSENNDFCSINTYSTFTRPFAHRTFIENVLY